MVGKLASNRFTRSLGVWCIQAYEGYCVSLQWDFVSLMSKQQLDAFSDDKISMDIGKRGRN